MRVCGGSAGAGVDDRGTRVKQVSATRQRGWAIMAAAITAVLAPSGASAASAAPAAVAPFAALSTSHAAATTTGSSVCDQAIAEAGTGKGRYGRYRLVHPPAQGGSGSDVVVGTDGP